MATDLRTQLSERSKDFFAYSLAVDESTDMTDTAQLAIFICGVDSNLRVTEEIMDIKSMHGTTTGKDIFENVCQSITDMKLPCDKLIALTTDGAPSMCGEKSGLVGRMRVKMQEENCTGELTAYHCIIQQEALCGKVLKMDNVMSSVTQTVNFIRAKGLNHQQFQSFMREIDSEFADIPYHTEVR
ncbi:general transcription factor II-I repeat domain-containing protein 2A-like [Python bivittatus]|uniref:General transcription factor II-I repeat domain-containing protein 2A-like n=1 Tax=Python bivittatus TaxID=176946 RepID=A0A9F3QSY7_PYTBI|nr:general transcription factor II-I repeat domain-containing protein 2A-like [Python bivittatus]